MRTKNLIIGLLCLVVLVVVFSMTTKSQKPGEQPKFEIIKVGTGATPKWSPDGTKLAFVYMMKLCVANVDGKGEVDTVAYLPKNAQGYDWLDSNEFVIWEKQIWRETGKVEGHLLGIKKVDMNGQVSLIREDPHPPGERISFYISPPFTLEDGTVGYYEVYEGAKGEETKAFRVIKEGKGKPDSWKKKMRAVTVPYGWGKIWVESLDETIKKEVSKGPATWLFPELSPAGNKIITLNHRAEMIIMDLQGNILANLGMGGCEGWSPDSKRIVFCIQKESEFDIIASELYIVNVDGTGKTQITDTPDEIETGPVWSPDGTKIACGSHSSAGIFVIKLENI